MTLRAKRTAGQFNISAGTLRNYEAKGLIPPAERSANGYRMYTDLHKAYLACIQAMAPAFGMDVTTEAIHLIQRGEWDGALWYIREQEVFLYEEKKRLSFIRQELESYIQESEPFNLSRQFNIHEASHRTGAPKTAIRYWEKEGLLTTERDPENAYRKYNDAHLLKIRLIQVLQKCVYSEETVTLKQSIQMIDHHDLEQLLNLTDQLLIYLNKSIRLQMRAISCLYELIQFITEK
ncbi:MULTISPECIES: MerR family DNA-binding transcriptional regulator [Paenibacillus]|uniref:MerR family DNA-binding transcriptional regulator n=1 Tax=Paenibacillus TaxID=44249 RepID=UPI00048E069D|nr:MerR family transcriptional regulator [Paenibacillus sp. IHBB 10380]